MADQYPSTDAGLFARYREATTQMALGNTKEAMDLYQQVIDRAGDGIYGQMARLGLAEAQARAGQFDQAINTYKELSQRKDGPLPVDGILMQLGQTYLDAGKPTRRAADLQPPRRGVPGLAVQRRRPARARHAEENLVGDLTVQTTSTSSAALLAASGSSFPNRYDRIL